MLKERTFEFKTLCDVECVDSPGTSQKPVDIASFVCFLSCGCLIRADIAIDFGFGAIVVTNMLGMDDMCSKHSEATK